MASRPNVSPAHRRPFSTPPARPLMSPAVHQSYSHELRDGAHYAARDADDNSRTGLVPAARRAARQGSEWLRGGSRQRPCLLAAWMLAMAVAIAASSGYLSSPSSGNTSAIDPSNASSGCESGGTTVEVPRVQASGPVLRADTATDELFSANREAAEAFTRAANAEAAQREARRRRETRRWREARRRREARWLREARRWCVARHDSQVRRGDRVRGGCCEARQWREAGRRRHSRWWLEVGRGDRGSRGVGGVR